MNVDIYVSAQGGDLRTTRTDLYRAANLLQTQVGTLEYAKSFGVDMNYFLNAGFAIQNQSFMSYCMQRMIESQINVMNAVEAMTRFTDNISYAIGESQSGTELIL